jgi:hypothetical protein
MTARTNTEILSFAQNDGGGLTTETNTEILSFAQNDGPGQIRRF